MFQAITDYLGTLVISLLLAGLVAGIMIRLHRDRKHGKSFCGCNCGCCPMAGTCHKQS